jgi:hypothetical protein
MARSLAAAVLGITNFLRKVLFSIMVIRSSHSTASQLILIALVAVIALTMPLSAAPHHAEVGAERSDQLHAAAMRFGTMVAAETQTGSSTGESVRRVASPLKTTVLLLQDHDSAFALVMTDFNFSFFRDYGVTWALRREAAAILELPVEKVLLFFSHNHSDGRMAEERVMTAFDGAAADPDDNPTWSETGRRFVTGLREACTGLRDQLQPVTVEWTEGHEDRITYNRKGRRADGTTYFMREEDRRKIGVDFRGDTDFQVPVVVLRGQDGSPVAGLLQFTGHPVTTFNPHDPVVHGEWPMIAADMLARELTRPGAEPVPVGFIQGCCGDVNSKEMFEGGVERAEYFGRLLGQSAIDVLGDLQTSRYPGADHASVVAPVPLADLPPVAVLEAELAEMDDFITRAEAGDPDTLECVGLNFPTALSPQYRANLVRAIRPWNEWALEQHLNDNTANLPGALPVRTEVVRLGDVAIMGIPAEPFLGIGRIFRAESPFALAIPCGYTNYSHGYIPDAPNVGDREYMSAFHRYTRYRAPFAKPAGDVIAHTAAQVLVDWKTALDAEGSAPASR